MEPPHVALLNAYARALAEEKGRPVPLFDPLDGGANARLLVLMESPSRRGVAQGFASADNPTPTGRRMREEFAAAGLRREDRVIWNVVPWYLGDEAKARNPTLAERREGAGCCHASSRSSRISRSSLPSALRRATVGARSASIFPTSPRPIPPTPTSAPAPGR